MQYISTRDREQQFSASQAIAKGLAEDGGLLTPVYLPKLPRRALEELKDMSYQQRAVYVMKLFLDEFSVKELTDFANAAYGPEKFDTPAVAPVRALDGNTYCLELWHGPTCAFKDMALQMLPHLLSASLVKNQEEKTVCILVATSGDTGKAALEGFKDVDKTRILVFYPKDGVSAIQELQMNTQEGDNVGVCSVAGNFDDAQTGVKRLFSDEALREKLAASCILYAPQVERRQVSSLDGTIKYLWRLRDGNCIETVLMRYHHGNTVCISSQVGCRMGCAFCASTLGGKVRDLTPAEMLDQVLFTQMDSGAPVSNIVLMGIGEPLDNFDTVLRFLELVNSPDGLNIGMRHISLSTCGLTEKIDKLADHQLQLTLSVSLHAPDDETRSRIMPVNRSVGVEKLFAACRRYFEKTGRRISYEYAMIDGVNDADWQADLLARHLKGTPGHVNLIPLNNVEESPLKPSRRVAAFQKRLESHGITATVRRKLGGDIDASCGQLRRKTMQQEHT